MSIALRSTVAPQEPAPSASARRNAVPRLVGTPQLVRAVLVLLGGLCGSLVLQLTIVSGLQHRAAQEQRFDSFREQLALGTAPAGPTREDGTPLAVGTPVAYVEARTIGLAEVVGEGTTPSALFSGPGHRRDTPLPGQQGTSEIYGRRAAFGGPFADIDQLRAGDQIVVTTAQGVFTFKVLGVRREGDPVPPPTSTARLTLVTAAGTPYMPDGVLRVDADLVGDATGGAPRLFDAASLPGEERLMAVDTRTLWALGLWLQLMALVAVAAVWSWHRWGRPQTWIVFLPPLLLVGLQVSSEVARILPNLM